MLFTPFPLFLNFASALNHKHNAPAGIRTRVSAVRRLNDWPDYTTGAHEFLTSTTERSEESTS